MNMDNKMCREYLPYPTETVTLLDRQDPKNLASHLLCQLFQLNRTQKNNDWFHTKEVIRISNAKHEDKCKANTHLCD